MPYKDDGLEHDTTFYIWDVQWRCKVPQLQTTDVEYIRFFGTPTTFNSGIDKEMAKQWIDTMLPIAKMVEYHRKGIPFRIYYYDDVKLIYDFIEKHLQAWANNLKNGLNIGDAPIDDLVAMNEFANTVYPLARPYFSDTNMSSSFMRAVSQLGFKDFNRRMKIVESADADESNNENVQRKDLGNVFKDASIRIGRWSS